MTGPRDSEQLEAALARLPRSKASDDFTERTVAALDHGTRIGSDTSRRLVLITVSSVLLAILLTAGLGYQRHRAAEQAYQQQVDDLKSRYQELLTEVTRVREDASTPTTRLYLGGDETLDLMIDLAQLEALQSQNPTEIDVRPATWEQ